MNSSVLPKFSGFVVQVAVANSAIIKPTVAVFVGIALGTAFLPLSPLSHSEKRPICSPKADFFQKSSFPLALFRGRTTPCIHTAEAENAQE